MGPEALRAAGMDALMPMPRLLAPLLSVLFFPAICRAGSGSVAAAEALHHEVRTSEEAGALLLGGPILMTASPITEDARWPASRCASLCRAPDRKRRGEGSPGEAPEECGVNLEFSNFGKDARLLGVDISLGALPHGPESLGVHGLSGGLNIDYDVAQQQRHTRYGHPSSSAHYTVSVRVLDNTAADAAEGSAAGTRPPDSATLRLEACGLSLGSVMGRGAAVFVAEPASNDDGDAVEDLQHLFGVLPTISTGRGGRGSSSVKEHQPVPRRLRNTATPGGSLVGREDNREETATTMTMAAAAVAVSATLERTGTIGHQGRRASPPVGGRRAGSRGLQDTPEDCDSPCLESDVDPCVNDPACEYGGVGCNAQGDLLCRFCRHDEGSVYSPCRDPDDPTPAPVPTPAPTADPDREECDARCRDNPDIALPCYDDPACGGDTDLLGCNAEGGEFCRFCTKPGGFAQWLFDCPYEFPTTTPTPAPTVAPSAAPTTPAPTTPAPSTAAPTAPAPTAAPTSAPMSAAPTTSAPTTLAPTAAPTAVPTPAPTSAPIPAPTTVAPTAALTAVPTVEPTSAAGELGPGSVKGSISASGIPAELVAEKGEERLVQEAVCALNPCPDGPDSVTVTLGGGDSARMLLSALQRRRRLADIVDAVFEVPTPVTDASTEPLTGSKQAAAFFNQAADPDAVAAAAAAFGIPVEDMDFGTLEYFEGRKFSIANEFGDVGENQEKEASTWATVIAAIILIAAMLLCSCCVFFLMKYHVEKRHGRRAGGPATRSPPRKSAVWTIDEEGGPAVQVGKSEMQASRSMGPGPNSALVRSSSQEHPDDARGGSGMAKSRASPLGRRPKTVPHTQSMGSEGSSIVSEKFTYSNPMHTVDEIKKTGSPKEYGDDLAQHYEGSEDATALSDISSELPHDRTSNPLFSSDSYRTGPSASSPTSAVDAARARSSSRGGGSSGYQGESGSGTYAESGAGHDSYSDWRSGATGSGTLEPMSSSSFESEPAEDTNGEGGRGAYQSRGGGGGMSVSESSSRMPFGLSPVAERNGEKGESSDMTTSSSSTTGGASTIYHARGGAGAPTSGITGPGSYAGSGAGGAGGGSYSTASGMDDDAESMFRPPSPGSVSRPLQPLLAQQSPLSSASAIDSRSNSFAMSSRSNSFASPQPMASMAGPGQTAWVPGVGLQKGIPTESLKAIKVAHGGDSEREAVREAVRRQRRKIARSLSHENASSSYQLSPMAEDPEHGAGEGTAAGLGEDEMGSYDDKIVISRSASASPRALSRRQNEGRPPHGSSTSDVRSLRGQSEVPQAAAGDGGTGDGGLGGAGGSSRMTSCYSEAQLTSASTLTSFNESTVGSPGEGLKKRKSSPNPKAAAAEVGGGIFQASDSASDASADAAAGVRGSSGGLAASLDCRVKSASVAPSPTHGPGGSRKEASKPGGGGGGGDGDGSGGGSVDEDGDKFYDASATPQDARAAAAAPVEKEAAAAAAARAAVEDQAAAARVAAVARAGREAAGGTPKGLRFSSRGRAMGRGRGTAGGRGAASAAGRGVAAGAKTRGDAAGKQKQLALLSMSKFSTESDSPGDREPDAPPPEYESLKYSTGIGGGSAAAAAAAAAAASVVEAAGAVDEASLKAAQECRDRAVEAGKAAGGAAAATGEAKTEAELMAAGAAAAAKATKGRQVNDDVRRKAIQAGAAAAAAAAQADGSSYGDGGGSRWSVGSSVGEVKSVLKTAGSFRNTEKPRSVSFVDGSSSEFDRVDDLGVGGMRGFRQHLADPSQPSGSYRRQESEESSSFSIESLSPSAPGSSMAGGPSHQESFDTVSTYSAASFASFATTPTSTNFSTAGGGAPPGGGGGSRGAGVGSQRSSYSFRRASSESSQSESDVDRPAFIQRSRGAGGGGSAAGGDGVGQRPLSWTSASDAEEQKAGGAVRRETSAEEAVAAAAAFSPAEVGATTATTAAAAAAVEKGQKENAAVSAYKKLFSTGGKSSSGRSSSSGESKRRMVMR
eukprot:g11430.t1